MIKIVSVSIAAITALAVSPFAGPYDAWAKYRTVTLNTSGSDGGANVTEAVANFPLLVRLTTANAADALSESGTDGASIRFATADGETALDYEIDTWTPSAAAVWVRVPSVAGNGTTTIRLYWGKDGATTETNGAAVFSTTDGFTGVWHLNEDGGGVGHVKDATANALHFTGHDSVTAVPGMVGSARWYNRLGTTPALVSVDSLDNVEAVQATGETTHLTISAWINRQGNGTSGQSQGIFGNFRYKTGTNAVNLRVFNIGLQDNAATGGNSNRFRFLSSSAGTSVAGSQRVVPTSAQFAATNTWMHVMATVDQSAPAASSVKLYVNGAPQTLGTITNPNNTAIFQTTDERARLLIGAQETSDGSAAAPFQGYIDEIQFTKGTTTAAVRSADWAKLSYETQKATVTAVTVGTTQNNTSLVSGSGSTAFRVTGTRRGYTFRLSQADLAAASLSLHIADVWGRTVWSRTVNPSSGIREITWNGLNAGGARVSAGMYVVRVYAVHGGKASEVRKGTMTVDR